MTPSSNSRANIWLIIFVVVAVLELVAATWNLELLNWFVKPLLMITLGLYYGSVSGPETSWRKYVFLALAFSWAGDVFLMLDEMFIPGLASFLIAHLFYINLYRLTGASTQRIPFRALALLGIYGAALMAFLYPHLGEMLVPVPVYALVILGMVAFALKRRAGTTVSSYRHALFGALLFVLSDSLIAVNKFATEIPFERVLIMSTYITAQYLIVKGLLQHKDV